MKTKGIRISDLKEGKCIPLEEILVNIMNADQLFWALLWLDVIPLKKEGEFLTDLQQNVNHEENGLLCTFEFLIKISKKFFQEIDIPIIACKEKEYLHRYKEDQDMYEMCDVVIEMIDGGFWEIFSKDTTWIDSLAKKSQDTEFLTSDFQNKE